MLKEKMITEFCGLSDEEIKLIKEKKDDIQLDFSIEYYGYKNIHEVFDNFGLDILLQDLEEYLPFIKEQKESIINKWQEDEAAIDAFIICIDNIIGSLKIDASKINSKFFERVKSLSINVDCYDLINDIFNDFVDMLSQKGTKEKIEILKMFLQKNNTSQKSGFVVQ